MIQFEEAFNTFLKQQKQEAKGSRLERIEKMGAAEILFLKEFIWPIFKSFEGFYLEYEMVNLQGIKIYIDIFYEPHGIAFECEGYVVHAEKISRDRFTFERMRVRSMVLKGYTYVPFTFDEMEKRPDACREYIYALLGRMGACLSSSIRDLKLPEREVLRYTYLLNRSFNARDVSLCLNYSLKSSRHIMRGLVQMKLISPAKAANQRHHYYRLTERAKGMLNGLG